MIARTEQAEFVGKPVAAFTTDGAEFGRGVVVSYTEVPSYQIERSDGSSFSWRADMCEPGDEVEWFPPIGRTEEKVLADMDTWALVAELARRGFLKVDLDLSGGAS